VSEVGRYVKRPVVVEAMRMLSYVDFPQGAAWINANGGQARYGQTDPGPAWLSIITLEGAMRVDPGDWIIRGVEGEFYPCKASVFAATYEPEPRP
jgi:hypothetical protein